MTITKERDTHIPILPQKSKVETYEDFSSRLTFEYSVITANIRCTFKRGKRILTKSDCKINKFIRCLTATDDKSAEISFVLRKFNLWNNEDFWKEIRLEDVMRFYARNYCHYDIREDQRGGGQNEAIIKNLFSILIFDWNKPRQMQQNYFLKLKFDKFASTSTLNLFQILYDILNRKHLAGYHHICLLIIYHYLYEVSRFEGEWSEDFHLTRLASINDVLIMHNTEYQIDILKILVVHWNVDYWRIHADLDLDDEYNLTSFRQKKLEYDSYKQSIMYLFNNNKPDHFSLYTRTSNSKLECSKQFFKLAFSLKEMTPKKFESEFEKFVKYFQDTYGEYWKVAIKSDVHLLLRIADGLLLYKTEDFLFKKCPFIALNWNILMNFEDIGEFRAILNRPLNRAEVAKINYIEREFQKIEDVFGRSEDPPPADLYIPAFTPHTNFVRDKFLSINSFTSDDSFKSTRHTNDMMEIEMRSFETVSDVFFDSESAYRSKSQQLITSMKVKVLKKVFKNCLRDRKILFGRQTANDLSLFEKILRTSAGSSFVNYAWNEFKLYENPEILMMVNPLGRTLVHYGIESKDDLNLITLLLPLINHKVEYKRHKHFMKALNNLYFSITGKTLIDFYLEVAMDDHSGDHEDFQGVMCKHIIHLLEEIGSIGKVTRDPLIDKLIHYAEDEFFYDKIVRRDSRYKVISPNERRKEKFHIDDLLGRMVVYWKPNGDEKIKGNCYPAYKRRLTSISPFFELIFNIVEHRSKNFKSNFRAKIHRLENFYDRRYNDIANSEYHTSSLTFIMLLAAIQTNEKGIIKFIFEQDIFETIKFEFPSNMKVGEIHLFTALMMLRSGYEMGKQSIPQEWITPSVLYEFLDSQVTYHNQELIEIDVSCLLHSETRKTVVKNALDLSDKLLLWDDDRTLQYIATHKNISSVLTHPVIAMFIELKYAKYQMIFAANFWLFVLLFVAPFALFIFRNDENAFFLFTLCIFAIVFFIVKEIFQYRIARNPHNYLKDLTNKIDIPLLALSLLLLVSFALRWESEIQALIKVIFIFVMIWDAMTMLPIEAVSRTLQIIKKVIRTFARVFFSFALIIFAFAISFRILFGNDRLDRVMIGGVENATMSSYEVPEREANMKNFEGMATTFVKVLVMMAGEYTIEPSKLKWFQLVLFGVFVVFSFIIFNLLLGMSIEDIQNLRDDALMRDLENKAKKIIETNVKFEEIYAERLFNKSKTISLSNRLIYRLSRLILSQNIFLHNFRKLYVNAKTREITVMVNGKQEKIMRKFFNFFTRKHFIKKESLDRIHEIIVMRDQENCLNVVRKH